MADYIPGGDAAFNAWLDNFVTYASANLANLGLLAGDLTPVTTAQTAWGTAYTANVTAQQAAKSATQQKNADRAAVVSLARALVGQLQASAEVDDTERAALGITVPDTEPTPTGPPTTRPILMAGCIQRLQHTIAFMDETTPTSKAKPAGVMGAETIRAAPVRKRLARYAKNVGLPPSPLPHGRSSDRNPTPTPTSASSA